MGKLKPFYSLVELSKALGMSRWTARRWLEQNHIPFELRRRAGSTRGGRIVVLLSEIRAHAPSYFASMRDDLEIE